MLRPHTEATTTRPSGLTFLPHTGTFGWFELMLGECVYNCIHPFWGGGGTCEVSDDGNTVCACDAGYASRDSKGNASCVPRRVLVTVYLLVGTVSLMGAALTGWNVYQYRSLPVRIQSARRTSIRLRALVSIRCGVREELVRQSSAGRAIRFPTTSSAARQPDRNNHDVGRWQSESCRRN